MKSAALLLFGLAALAQDTPRVLEGTVVNSVTGIGIDGATVTLAPFRKNNNDPIQADYQSVTDASGTFRIGGVKPGEYIPWAQRPGYRPFSFGAVIHIGQDTPPLRLELIPPARVRGRVMGTDGKPAAEVRVAIGDQYANTATTDAEGAFVFDKLDPGSYGLLARANHVRTYFPATVDPALAEPILVRAGARSERL